MVSLSKLMSLLKLFALLISIGRCSRLEFSLGVLGWSYSPSEFSLESQSLSGFNNSKTMLEFCVLVFFDMCAAFLTIKT